MSIDVRILSKRRFNELMSENDITDENVEDVDNAFMISINDTNRPDGFRPQHFKDDHDNVMVLEFDDVDNEWEVSPTNKGKCTPFSEEQAIDLFNFINRNKDKHMCIVHCEAGISRSGAVGTFVHDYIGGDFNKFKYHNGGIVPNARVSRMLSEVRRNYES